MLNQIPQSTSEFEIDLALIDFDVLRYELGSVMLDHPMGKELGKVRPSDSFIEDLVDTRINEIMDSTGAKDYICYVTGKDNFRFDIAKQEPYKGNRDDFEKPEGWAVVDSYGSRKYKYTLVEGTEADDELGIIQRKFNQSGVKTVICSRDKDLRMVEGLHYSWGCGENQPAKPVRYITYLEGMRFFFQQLLTGDSVDNIMGCGIREDRVYGPKAKKAGESYRKRVGIGPKEAETLLVQGDDPQSWYNIIRAAYIVRFGDEEADDVLLEMARLLYIGQQSKDDMFVWKRIGVMDARSNAIQDQQEQISTTVDDTSGTRELDSDVREDGREDAREVDNLQPEEYWASERDDGSSASF